MLLSSVPPFNSITLSPIKTTVTVPIPSACHHRFTFIRRHHSSPNFKFVRNSMREAESVTLLEAEEAELLLATCITRTLPPALTLESGLGSIKNAVEELKTKPSCAKSGMYRFQRSHMIRQLAYKYLNDQHSRGLDDWIHFPILG